ncbi:MAG: uroporphyrinogen-III C-methyltransferase [Bryobacterales bacterium]|nr:uroporphyrinogen-III C-methyltransferase [Bryobacterales bacterium]
MPEFRQPAEASPGTVYLVGAGPGDPDLLTLRAHDLLLRSDLVLFDNLTSSDIVAFAPQGAERRYVGKKRAEHAFTQAEINALMIAAARKGKVVVRLKGGDPYVFGRGGEEAQELVRAGVPFEVVPGVTSALGAAAYAGMPLTHRDYTQSVTMLTGHDVDQIDWKSMAGRQTLVVFMGLTSIAEIARRLQHAGRDPGTPAAAVRWVTRGDQEVVTSTLAELPSAVRREGLRPPALVVIGEIVRLRDEIDWFAKLPLRGQSVAVTRAAAQAAPFCQKLRRLGAEVHPIPVIEFEDPEDWGPVDRAICSLPSYDWLVFTSVNGVDRFVARLDASSRDLRDLPRKICAIGPATADRVRSLHVAVTMVPNDFVAESVVEAFRSRDLHGARMLLPRAQEARDVLPVQLAAMGVQVDVVAVYRTVPPPGSRALARAIWESDNPPDWVTATSSSTVRHLASMVPADRLRRSRVASIGPVTSGAARELGLTVSVEASTFTTDGLVQALCAHSAANNVLR